MALKTISRLGMSNTHLEKNITFPYNAPQSDTYPNLYKYFAGQAGLNLGRFVPVSN
jgi:hypothetical protein